MLTIQHNIQAASTSQCSPKPVTSVTDLSNIADCVLPAVQPAGTEPDAFRTAGSLGTSTSFVISQTVSLWLFASKGLGPHPDTYIGDSYTRTCIELLFPVWPLVFPRPHAFPNIHFVVVWQGNLPNKQYPELDLT